MCPERDSNIHKTNTLKTSNFFQADSSLSKHQKMTSVLSFADEDELSSYNEGVHSQSQGYPTSIQRMESSKGKEGINQIVTNSLRFSRLSRYGRHFEAVSGDKGGKRRERTQGE